MIHRRDFFDPRPLLQPVADILAAVEEVRGLVNDADTASQASLLRFGRRAMATLFEVLLPFGTTSAHEAAQAALDEIDRLEAQLTVYREDSEVSALNREAATRPVSVKENLFDLLERSCRLHEETEGAFDIAVGALIKTWGFFRRQGRVPSDQERTEVMERIGMRHVILDPEKHVVSFARPGVEINLGSIGKGYALDCVAAKLRQEWNIACGLIHGGQSSVIALGSEPGSSRGWSVGILDPRFPSRRLAVLRLKDRALGTSAATFQHFEHEGRRLGHILDPRSGWPAEGMLSATVLAPSAAEADALATAFYVLGPDKARSYCGNHPEIAALLLPHVPNTQPVALNLGKEDVQLL